MDRYAETLNRIYRLRGGEIDLRLDRMDRALALFDHPEKKFPVIHIAGTNGKGSTSAMVHGILDRAGYRAALYTSPHLVSFTERIRIGKQEILPLEVVALSDEIAARTAAADIALTYFEFVTAMAFIYFARHQIDVAVVEVGLGGRFDATNVVIPLVSVITTIALDHENFLGSDLLGIAKEKAGIIKPGIAVVVGAVAPAVRRTLSAIAAEQRSTAYVLGRDFRFSLKKGETIDYTGIKQHYSAIAVGLRGRHQKINACTALASMELIRERFPFTEAALRDGLKTVDWPGRFEIVSERPTIVLDGAHNLEGVTALAEELTAFRAGRRVRLLFACMNDKQWERMLAVMMPVVDEVVLTRVGMQRSAAPAELAGAIAGNKPVRIVDDPRAAVEELMASTGQNEIILIAGSLYLLGEIKPLFFPRNDAAGAAATRP